MNEFLIETGAAYVDRKADLKKKGHFLLLEDAARKKGEGIWSYDGPALKQMMDDGTLKEVPASPDRGARGLDGGTQP